jgi:two-component system, NtrC family, sensor kinase
MEQRKPSFRGYWGGLLHRHPRAHQTVRFIVAFPRTRSKDSQSGEVRWLWRSSSQHTFITTLFLIVSTYFTFAQNNHTITSLTYSNHVRDSLLAELVTVPYDTGRVWTLYELAGIYRFNQPDSGIYYGIKAWELARKINHPAGEVAAMRFIAISHIALGLYGRALQWDLEGIKLTDQYGLLDEKIIFFDHLGTMYLELDDYPLAIEYFKASALLSDSAQNHSFYVSGLYMAGEAFLRSGELDSAKYYVEKAYDYMSDHEVHAFTFSDLHSGLGRVYHAEGRNELALIHFRKSYEFKHINKRDELRSAIDLADFYYKEAELDSSKWYAQIALKLALEGHFYAHIVQASNLLSDIYREANSNESLRFKTMAMAYQDSLLRLGRTTAFKNLIDFDEQERQLELAAAEEDFQSQLRTNAFLVSSFTLIVIAILLYRNNRIQKKAKRKN